MKGFTRTLCAVLALVLVLSVAPMPAQAADGFADVSAEAWYAQAVDYVSSRGYMNGVGGNAFAPDLPLTRAMFVTILARVAGAETDDAVSAFADVPAGQWYTGAAAWAAAEGVVNGVGNNNFAPLANVTRQDLCTMIGRYADRLGLPILAGDQAPGFADRSNVSAYAGAAVELCAAVGLVGGFPDGTFRPTQGATRAQTAKIIMLLDRLLADRKDQLRPAQRFDAEAQGVAVNVAAPGGALPGGTDMIVTRLTDEAALADIAARVEGKLIAAVDISFRKDQAELEPGREVEVCLSLEGLEDVENPAVVHLKDDGTLERVENVELISLTRGETKALRFWAGEFSVYAIIGGGGVSEGARLKITFQNGADNPTFYLRKGDVPDHVEEIIHDPGIPVAAGKLFVGWSETQNDTAEQGMTIAQVRQLAAERVNAGVAEGDELILYPIMKAVYYLYYSAEDGSVFQTEVVFHSEGSSVPAQITVNALYTATQANQGFLGWVVQGTEEPVYKNGSTLTITADTTLVPKIGAGHWLYFDENDGGVGVGNASYTPPVFVPAGETTAAYRPANPTRPGYIFGGWYTAAEGGSLYPFTEDLDSLGESDSLTLYAHWTAEQTAPYKVVIWAQNVNDDKVAADSAKTYDYVKSFELTAATDTQVTDALMAPYMGYSDSFFGVTDLDHGSTAFQYSRWEVKNGAGTNKDCVSSTGDTVVNVYYDRKLFTIRFTGVSGGTTETYYDVVDTPSGTEVYGLIDGEYVRLDHQLVGKKLVALKKSDHNTVYADITGIYRYKDDKFITYDEIMNYSGNSNLEVGKIYKRMYTGTNYTLTTSTSSGYSTMYTKSSSGSKIDVDLRVDGVYDYTYQGATYPGPYFVKVSGNVRIFTGLYGQSFTKYNYEWFTPDSTHAWKNVAFLDSFNGNLFGASGVGSTPNLIMLTRDDSTFDTSIVFWTQSAGNLSTYVKAGTAGYSVGTDQGFNVTDRIQGMISEGYMWSTSEAMPSQWKSAKVMNSTTDGINNDGYTNVKRGNNTYLHIKYDRAVHDIIFLNGDNEVKTVADVPFGVSLAPYEAETPTISQETIQEGYYFAGWYEDPTFQKAADWSGTMPLSNKTLYARIAPVEYHVIVELNGGSIDTSVQALNFWVPYNTVLDDTNFLAATPPDDHHSLIGYYTDAAFTKLWNFDTRLTNDSLTLLYTGPDDPARATYGDAGWDTTVGVFKLFARWRDDSIASLGGLTIQYYSGDTLVYTDPVKYGDLATVIASGAPSSEHWPEGQHFDHWELNGKSFYPTEEFEADSALAVDMTVDGNPSKVIQIHAVYADDEPKTDTHIYWYSNIQDIDGNPLDPETITHGENAVLTDGKGWTLKDLNLQINVGVDIPAYNTYSVEGFTFMGWARVENADAGTASLNLRSADDLFLKWVPDDTEAGGHYEAKNENDEWVTVTQVAANEETPYHDLYAVWRPAPFFVFHSSTGKLEAVNTTVSTVTQGSQSMLQTNAVDLTALVADGYLYGGYYKVYGGVNTQAVQAAADSYHAPSVGGWAASATAAAQLDTGAIASMNFVAYTGESLKNGSVKFWDKANAYQAADDAEPGNALHPKVGTVYYLKEVPQTYLASKFQYVYDTLQNDRILNLFLLTLVDDSLYADVGFRVADGADLTAAGNAALTSRDRLASSFTIVQKGNGIPGHEREKDVAVTTDASKFGLTRGYVAVKQLDSLVVENNTFTMLPTWQTLDGVTVGSKAPLALTVNEDKTAITYERLSNEWLGTEKLYVNTQGMGFWEDAGALTKLYFYGPDGNTWVDTQLVSGTLHVATIPAGTWTTVIVVRINPNGTGADNWANKWNQSCDITLHKSLNLIYGFYENSDYVDWRQYTP